MKHISFQHTKRVCCELFQSFVGAPSLCHMGKYMPLISYGSFEFCVSKDNEDQEEGGQNKNNERADTVRE
jgi:hypothetical protein